MKRSSFLLVAILCAIGLAPLYGAEKPRPAAKAKLFSKAQPAKALPPEEAESSEEAETPAKPPETFREKLLSDPSVDRSRKDFSQCQEATAELRLTEKSYVSGQVSLASLLSAERKLTATQIHYMAVSNGSRGVPAMRELLVRQGEVASLERGLASTTSLTGKATDADLPQVREEVKQYEKALKEARRELLKAEYAWKTASRADQFRYLNRKEDRR